MYGPVQDHNTTGSIHATWSVVPDVTGYDTVHCTIYWNNMIYK